MSKQEKSRQQLACDYIQSNYVAHDRLRYDLVAQKVQLRDETSTWRYMDIEPLHGAVEIQEYADGLYINEIRKKLTLTNDLLLKNV